MKRLWITGGLALIGAIVFLSLTPNPIESDITDGDKLQHLLAYGVLMAWWSQLQLDSSGRLRLALGFMALGIALEIAQSFTPHRQPDVFDALADSAGVLLGWLAAPPRIPNFLSRLAAVFPGTGG